MADKGGGFYFSEEVGFNPNVKKSPKKGDKKNDGKKESNNKNKKQKD